MASRKTDFLCTLNEAVTHQQMNTSYIIFG